MKPKWLTHSHQVRRIFLPPCTTLAVRVPPYLSKRVLTILLRRSLAITSPFTRRVYTDYTAI